MIKTDLSDDTFDGYLIAPLQSESVASLIADTEKPVMAFDTDIDSDKCLAFIGTGNKEAAKQGALAAVEAAKAAGWETIQCIEIAGVQGLSLIHIFFPRRHIHCNRPDRRDLHRCIRKRQLHRDQQPDREQRPNKANGPRRIAFFHDPPQQEQHQRCRRHGQSNLHHIIDQSAPTDWEHILPLQSYRPCASRKARRSSMSCSVSAPASDRLATRFFTEPPHSRRTKLVLSRCR